MKTCRIVTEQDQTEQDPEAKDRVRAEEAAAGRDAAAVRKGDRGPETEPDKVANRIRGTPPELMRANELRRKPGSFRQTRFLQIYN